MALEMRVVWCGIKRLHFERASDIDWHSELLARVWFEKRGIWMRACLDGSSRAGESERDERRAEAGTMRYNPIRYDTIITHTHFDFSILFFFSNLSKRRSVEIVAFTAGYELQVLGADTTVYKIGRFRAG